MMVIRTSSYQVAKIFGANKNVPGICIVPFYHPKILRMGIGVCMWVDASCGLSAVIACDIWIELLVRRIALSIISRINMSTIKKK